MPSRRPKGPSRTSFRPKPPGTTSIPYRSLGSAFCAWAEVVYNKRVHSATGETPDDRFLKGIPKDNKRITDLESFSRLFLWKENRTVKQLFDSHEYKEAFAQLKYGIPVEDIMLLSLQANTRVF